MRAIIPAAGLGRRLRPYTERTPKCVLPVGGVSIVERLLAQLVRLAVSEAVIVVGHEADVVRHHVAGLADRPRVRFVHNSDYACSNSIVSVLATAAWWDDEFLIIDSDLLVSTRLLRALIAVRGNAMAVDTGRPAERIDMAVELRGGNVWDLDKQMPAERTHGESLPLSRWTVDGGTQLRSAMADLVRAGQTDVWYQYAIRDVAKRMPLAAVAAESHEWAEVDSPADLRAAQAAFATSAF